MFREVGELLHRQRRRSLLPLLMRVDEVGVSRSHRVSVLLPTAENGRDSTRLFRFMKHRLGRRLDWRRGRNRVVEARLERRMVDTLAEAFEVHMVVDPEGRGQHVVDVGEQQGEFAVEPVDLCLLGRDIQLALLLLQHRELALGDPLKLLPEALRLPLPSGLILHSGGLGALPVLLGDGRLMCQLGEEASRHKYLRECSGGRRPCGRGARGTQQLPGRTTALTGA